MAKTIDERTFDTILTTSGNKYMAKVVDNIGKANALFWTLNKDGFKKVQNGGERIEIPVRMTKSTSGGWYRDSDLLNTNPADPLTKSWWEWNQIAYSIVLSGLEEFKNQGIGRLISLMQALYDDAEDSMTEDITTAMFGTPTELGKQIDGLQAIVPEDPTSATGGRYGDGKIGAIDQNAESWWRNQVGHNSGTSLKWQADADLGTAPTAWVAMEALYENCSKGGGARNKREPNIGISNQIFYQNYLTGLVQQKRFKSTDMADAGFKNVLFSDMPITWDESCESVSSSSSVGCCYFLNKHFLHWVVGAGRDFKKTPFIRPANQDARISQILLIGNMCCSARRKQGILVDTDLS